MTLPVGFLLQRRYEVGAVLGLGASATTYAARDRLLGRTVALKVLHHATPELIAALLSELNRLRGLWHPRLARVLDLGTDRVDGAPCWFLTSERVDGVALNVHAEPLTWNAIETAVCDALEALSFLHHVGTRHGDVKPDNILVTGDGHGVLIDLGCARSLQATIDLAPSGTPAFMAPELLQGDPVDERADLFALGRSLLALPITYPNAVQQVLARMCAASPAERPSSADEALELFGHPRATQVSVGGRSTQLLERDGELQRFTQMLDALVDGRPEARAFSVHGASGLGRTRLLDELKWIAQPRCSVVIAQTSAGGALADCLMRATDTATPPRSLADVLALRSRVNQSPLVLVIDDAQRLSEEESTWLTGLLRTTTAEDRWLFVVASDRPIDHQQNAHVAVAPLSALSREGVKRWVGVRLADSAIAALHRLTGGFPSYVQLALDRLSAGSLREADLIAGRTEALTLALDLSGLDRDDHEVLAALCAESQVPLERWGAEAKRDALARFVSRGLVTVSGRGVSLTRGADADGLRAALPIALVHAAHAAAARALEPAHDESARAAHATHLFQAGAIERAAAEIAAASTEQLSQPRKWLASALLLTAESTSHDHLLPAARLALQAGEPKQTLSWVARVLRRPQTAPLPTPLLLEARCLAADAYTQLGAHKRAQTQLNRAQANNAEERVMLSERRARLCLQQAAYADARDMAKRALAETTDTRIQARLHETLGVAATYLGERESALRALSEAERLHAPSDVRARYRCLSYRAMLELRSGHLSEAALGYNQALRIAETSGLADLYVNAALNAGSAAHQLGDWGPVLVSYERAIGLALALGKQSTLASLQFNLANLYCEIGTFERAATMLTECDKRVRTFGIKVLSPYLTRLRAELALARTDQDAAASIYLEAKDAFALAGARREALEVDVELAGIALLRGDHALCEQQLDAIDSAIVTLEADDLHARVRLLRARCLIAAQQLPAALPLLDNALSIARRSEHRLLCADILSALNDLHRALGSDDLAQACQKEAASILARVAASLPHTMRDAFHAHPRRRQLAQPPTVQANTTATSAADTAPGFDLSGFLEINRRINSSLSVDQVLSHAMDAAIALTGAERGFVLLTDAQNDMDVSVARNVDREHLGKAHMKFSRSIAEQVIQTREPLLTVDAGNDSRFSAQQSVHAMKLKSVVCVPIRSPLGVLGALYLDNRFQRGRFRQEDIDVLMAFADQVAIAITNARLHADLEQRTRELDEERKRVEKLARGQAIEIGRLQGALEKQQRTLELRHDYSGLVCRSAGMRELLGTLDRVTDSNLSVLIQGESGTGKEVIARAIHFNGPRRKEPFISINCGALPEPLLESELFGHVKGAFTGADRDRAGLFVAARGGTLLLDEVGEMSPGMQVKLLRVLQEREVRRVGSSRVEPVDVRVLCATNRNLHDDVGEGRFREDLYYRLAVVELTLPPLRERTEDLSDLCSALLKNLCASSKRNMPRLSSEAIQVIQTYAWPGNVRELENVLSRALVMCEGDTILASDLALSTRHRRINARDRNGFEQDEAARLFSALSTQRWNVSAVSRELGIPRNTLYRKLQKYRLTRAPGT